MFGGPKYFAVDFYANLNKFNGHFGQKTWKIGFFFSCLWIHTVWSLDLIFNLTVGICFGDPQVLCYRFSCKSEQVYWTVWAENPKNRIFSVVYWSSQYDPLIRFLIWLLRYVWGTHKYFAVDFHANQNKFTGLFRQKTRKIGFFLVVYWSAWYDPLIWSILKYTER